jgi:hypothetical protein
MTRLFTPPPITAIRTSINPAFVSTAGLFWYAEHVCLLGGASPLFNLMEVKNE